MEMNEIMKEIRELSNINDLHELCMKVWDDLDYNTGFENQHKREMLDNIAKLRTQLDLIEDAVCQINCKTKGV